MGNAEANKKQFSADRAVAYIIGNWNNLARIVFDSFAGLGLKASGTGFSAADLMRPGKVAQTGLDAGDLFDELFGPSGR